MRFDAQEILGVETDIARLQNMATSVAAGMLLTKEQTYLKNLILADLREDAPKYGWTERNIAMMVLKKAFAPKRVK